MKSQPIKTATYESPVDPCQGAGLLYVWNPDFKGIRNQVISKSPFFPIYGRQSAIKHQDCWKLHWYALKICLKAEPTAVDSRPVRWTRSNEQYLQFAHTNPCGLVAAASQRGVGHVAEPK